MRERRGSAGRRALDDAGRVNRLYAVLSRVNEAIIRIREPQELYDAACRIAVEDGAFLLAWIGFVDPSTKEIHPIAKYGRDDDYLDGLHLSIDESVPEGRGPTGVAMREGRPFVNNDTATNPIMVPWRDEQMKRGFMSTASFPLKTDGSTVGVITLYAGAPHYFDEEEVRLLETLADDFSFALESSSKARLYDVEHGISSALQAALLTLPASVPGIVFASSYSSATESMRVGGDFYDVFELDGHRLGITIGDISGKGLEAAVLTSLVRNTIRAYASEPGKTPAQVLRQANVVVYAATPAESFATVLFAMMDRRDGRVVYASAAHPAAALIRKDGDVVVLGPTGSLLGAFEDAMFEEAATHMALGDRLFLYTDGLTEARRGNLQYGEERLMGLLAGLGDRAPSAVIDAVLEDVRLFATDGLRDDLATLAIGRVAG
jgi:serine phosphatase RsbU (regulator of sigma subunit)